LTEIVETFQQVSGDVETEGEELTRWYLGEDNGLYEPVCEQYGIIEFSAGGRKSVSNLGDALELIATALDRSQHRTRVEYSLSKLEWRSIGTTLLGLAL